MSTTESEKPSGGVRPLQIGFITPPASTALTKVRKGSANDVTDGTDLALCKPGRICARGTVNLGGRQIESVAARIYEMNEVVPVDRPSKHTLGAVDKNLWYFDEQHGTEIPHNELAKNPPRDMQLGVWVKYTNGDKDHDKRVFRTGTVGDETECTGNVA